MQRPRWRCRNAAVLALGLFACPVASGQVFAPSVLEPAASGTPPPYAAHVSPDWHLSEALPPAERAFASDALREGPLLHYSPDNGNVPPGWAASTWSEELWYRIGGKARGYYINDQRIEFTGQEATFAAEGVIDGGLLQRVGAWQLTLDGELFLNQPFDRNILVDTANRRSFTRNFDIEPLQISQLLLGARYGDLYAGMGRFVTPFGRFYYPNYRNNFDDSPFIRSDAILYRETGLLLQWDPAWWVFTAAVTNGGPEQDTNSSKALVARVGIDQPWFAAGASVKVQDGIGSEGQKEFNEHVGVDAMLRRGAWTLSAEAIYDRYGLRRPGTALTDIFWGRSLYFRDLNNGYHHPITGVGYYANLGYEGPFWTLMLNYGEFHPETIGDPRHDQPIRRGLLKASRHWTRHFETYGAVLIENDRVDDLDTHPRKGIYVLCGCQVAL
jgi:hypothetical protein